MSLEFQGHGILDIQVRLYSYLWHQQWFPHMLHPRQLVYGFETSPHRSRFD